MLHHPGSVGPGAPVRHLHPAPSLQGRKQHEQVAHSVAFVFVIVRHGSPGLRREGLVGLLHQLFAGLVQTHQHLVSLAEGLDTGDGSPTAGSCSTCYSPWPNGRGRPSGTGSGPAWTAPRQRAGPEAGPRRWTPRSCRPSGTSWQRRIGQRGRPGVPGEPAHREGGQGTDTSGDSAVRPRRAVPRRGDRGTKPSSSTISRLRRDICRCRLSSGISSRVSSGPLYLVFAGATPRHGYPGGVLRQHGTAGPPGLPHGRGVRRPWLETALFTAPAGNSPMS